MTDEDPEDRQAKKPKRRVRRILISLGSIYLFLIVFLIIAEPYLIYPVLLFGDDSQQSEPSAAPGSFEVGFVKTEDDVNIQYVHYRHPPDKNGSRGVILYCHGNGEWLSRISDYVVFLGKKHGLSAVAFDYRGYGQSEGFPHEAGILKDSDAVYRFLIDEGYSPDKILIYGRSLGGGPACYLAANYQIGGLILHSTFSSLVDVAAATYWFMPVRLIMRNRFRSINHLKNYRGPMIQFHGTSDRIVSLSLSKKLFESAGSADKEFMTQQGGKHNSRLSPNLQIEFDRFVARILDR